MPDLTSIPARALIASLLAAVVIALVVWLGRIPIKYNLRNLVVRWKTTLLTAAAFMLVILLLTVMLAFVNGMSRLTQTSGKPGNVLVMSEGSTDEAFSNLSKSSIEDVGNQPGVLRENSRPVWSRETYVVVNQPVVDPAPRRPTRRLLQVRGVEDSAVSGRVHGLKLCPGGEWISAIGTREIPAAAGGPAGGINTASEALIGEGIAREMARDRTDAARAKARDPERMAIGDTLLIANRPCIIVGIIQSSGATFDSEVWVKSTVVKEAFRKEAYTSLVLSTKDAESAQQLRDYLNTSYKKASLLAVTETDYYNGLSATNKQFLIATIIVAAIVAVGGVLGVMNTMFAAISLRTKDIAVLRIIGFRRWQILVSFTLESMAIALLGGLLGLGVGLLCDGWTATSVVSSGQGGGGKFVVLKLVVDARILGTGMLLALAMGFFGGLLPAVMGAIRLKPLEALR
ncbi:MAG: ABC transporter permease [Planctomycetia bacterium]|nr:ABC transporter permease [Planctomycetia bacterium]